jgi:aryl-alcohol dehydrogenase-like predicted oxidoreductase
LRAPPRAGVIQLGVSHWQAWKIARALGVSELKDLARFDSLQAYYSIAGRDLEREVIPLLESEKVGLLVWGPLAGGLLSGKFSRHNQKPENSRRSDVDFPIVNKERACNIIDVMGQSRKLTSAARRKWHLPGYYPNPLSPQCLWGQSAWIS